MENGQGTESAWGATIGDELQQEIDKGQVTLIIGAGVSIAATGNPDVASWSGLLKRGVEECVRVAQLLPDGWAQRVNAEIASPDVEDLLSAATKIERKLGGPKGGTSPCDCARR